MPRRSPTICRACARRIVFDLPRKRLALVEAARAGGPAAHRGLRPSAGHAADLEGGDRAIFGRDTACAPASSVNGALASSTTSASTRKSLPRMIDQCAAPRAARGRAAATRMAAAGIARARPTRSPRGARAKRLAAAAAWSRSRRAPSARRSGGHSFGALATLWRRRTSTVWIVGGPGETAQARDIIAEIPAAQGLCATSPARTCATPSLRSPPPTWRCRTTPDCCMSPPRWARRRSAFSGRPVRGIGRRLIRSPPSCRPTSMLDCQPCHEPVCRARPSSVHARNFGRAGGAPRRGRAGKSHRARGEIAAAGGPGARLNRAGAANHFINALCARFRVRWPQESAT